MSNTHAAARARASRSSNDACDEAKARPVGATKDISGDGADLHERWAVAGDAGCHLYLGYDSRGEKFLLLETTS
jgi:hypothetical protein